jgi:hypothetical protein
VYKVGYRFLGGAKLQERIWHHVLSSLAHHFGVVGQVQLEKICVDRWLQWTQAENIWYNAGIRTVLNTPVRVARRLIGG